jgi:tol-pal system protein YbgF
MILIFGPFLAVDGASAQDLQSLIDRLNSLERDLADTQSQVFGPGAKPRSGTISSKPLNSRQSEPRSQDSAFQQVPMLARHQIQLQQLEGQLRDLTGQVEDANYNIQQFGKRLDRLVSDVDFRLQSLEAALLASPRPQASTQADSQTAGTATGTATGAATGAATGTATAPVSRDQRPAQSPMTSLNTGELVDDRGTRVIGQIPVPADAASGTSTAPAKEVAAVIPPPILPVGTPREQYNFAFSLLRKHDYQGAEAAFNAFLEQNPSDGFASNAQYWLGETHYVRQQFEQAAVAFASGYQKYPEGKKAPDSLLKLAMALAKMAQTEQACLAFQQLNTAFPAASKNLLKRARSEERKIGCGG